MSAVVVKLGGEVVASPQGQAVAQGIARLVEGGARICVVHGAGPQVSGLQQRLALPVRKVAGRRVTDEETLKVVKMAVGQVNVDLCAALRRCGVRPVGLHGAVFARRRPPRVYEGEGSEPVDLGLVGDVTGVDLGLLELLLSDGRVPVLACLGVGDEGAVYNINADTVASGLSQALGAARLIMVSDLPVLRDIKDRGSLIPALSAPGAEALLREGVAQGGMAVKIEEALAALRRGVGEVAITTDLGADTTVLRG
jgi:acetylglutamate kinase